MNNDFIPKEVSDPIFTEEQIALRMKELGAQITQDYQGKSPLLVAVLKGAFLFLADLMREIKLDLEVDFIVVSSYGSSIKSSGVVKMVLDIAQSIEGKDVILVEDVIDTGLTIEYLKHSFEQRNPKSLKICSLLLKEGVVDPTPHCDYVGFKVPPDYVVGYGFDVDQKFRNIPYIANYLPVKGQTSKPE